MANRENDFQRHPAKDPLGYAVQIPRLCLSREKQHRAEVGVHYRGKRVKFSGAFASQTMCLQNEYSRFAVSDQNVHIQFQQIWLIPATQTNIATVPPTVALGLVTVSVN